MSWLSDLAGKAEDILNKIDQNAANVLKDKTIITDQLTDVLWHNSAHRSSLGDEPVSSRSSSPATFTSSTPFKAAKQGRSNAPSPAPRVPPLLSNLSKKDEDEEFYKFLNGTDVLQYPTESDELRRSPSGASVASVGSFSAVGGQDSQTESRTNSPSLGSISLLLSKDDIESSAIKRNINTDNADQTSHRNTSEAISHTQTPLFNENEMLRKEVRTLNHEVSLLLRRAKAAEEELASISKNRASTDNLQSELAAVQKCSKKVEMELAKVRKENESLQQMVGKEPHMHSDEELQALRDKIEKLIAERDSHFETSQELSLQVTRLQETVSEFSSQCDRMRQQLSSALAETEQYRARATRILQEKEQVIASLQSRSQHNSDESEAHSSQSSENIWEKQVEQLRRERNLDREEIAQLTENLRTLREELQSSERRLEEYREKGSREADRFRNRLAAERARRVAAEEDSKKYSEELVSIRNEITKERQSLNVRVRERDIEIAKLRSTVSPMKNGNASSSPAELEARVRQLATTLVQKQGALEAVLAERNALKLQLERSEVVCHLWVLLVLLTYTPESQSSRHSVSLAANPKEPGG